MISGPLWLMPNFSFEPFILRASLGNIKLPDDLATWAHRRHVLFVGHGPNPTNFLSIQWFLMQCWPLMRRILPTLELHLVGADPALGGGCTARGVHCGWTDGTVYLRRENEHGIFIHGKLDDDKLATLYNLTRLFIAPIINSTGVNTKSFKAMAAGLPVVMTPKASVGLGFDQHDPAALIVSDPIDFVSSVIRVHEDEALWMKLSQRSIAHARKLIKEDIQKQDTHNLLFRLEERVAELHQQRCKTHRKEQ